MEHNQSPVSIEGYRNVFCPYYSDCLNHAAKNYWEYWACMDCQHKKKQSFPQDVMLSPDNAYPYYSLSPSLYNREEFL